MRWLLIGPSSEQFAEPLQILGHATRLPADVALAADAAPEDIFEASRKHQLDVFTNDPDLANAPFDPDAPAAVATGRTMVFVQATGDAADPATAVERLFDRYKRLSPGRLYTITGTRVKVRQLPKGR